MALSYANISVELREISLRNRPEELYKASPKGTVPVLITAGDLVIDESLNIMIWALDNKQNQTWMNKNSKEEFDSIHKNDTTFKECLDKYKYHDRYPKDSKEYYREKCSNILSDYENQSSNTKYLLRNDLSIADVAIFPFIRQFANVDYEWFGNNFNQLTPWLEKISISDLFISIMNKYDTWNNTDKPCIIEF